MRILIQLYSLKPQTRLAIACSTALAAVKQGHDVSFFLASEGVYVGDPDTYVRSSSQLGGLADPHETLSELRARGVIFYADEACARFCNIAPSDNVTMASFDQLAAELVNYDHVLTFGP